MIAEFKVGEIAGLHPYKEADVKISRIDRYFGTDVTIVSGPLSRWEYIGGTGYWVRAHDGREFDVGAVCLRKKPPAPDWIKLCHLTESLMGESV